MHSTSLLNASRMPGAARGRRDSAASARPPLTARLNAAESGRSATAVAAERARQAKAAAAAAAKTSFAAAFAGIGEDVQAAKSRCVVTSGLQSAQQCSTGLQCGTSRQLRQNPTTYTSHR